MSHVFEKLNPFIKKGCSVLDFGCGSGRDSFTFFNLGCDVTALDGSKEFIDYLSGSPFKLINQSFTNFNAENKFDLIYCCASLLHLNDEDLLFVLKNLKKALKSNGILYCSFKNGEGIVLKNDLIYNNFNFNRFNEFIKETGLVLNEHWESVDSLDKKRQTWHNFILKKEY